MKRIERQAERGPSTDEATRTRRHARVGAVDVLDVVYPPGLTLPRHQHQHGYLCLVASGGFTESWRGQERDGVTGSFLYYPSQLMHHGRYGDQGARVLHLEIPADDPAALCPDTSVDATRREDLRDTVAAGLGWQLLRELEADTGADTSLALEVLVADLVAEAFGATLRRRGNAPPWLGKVEEVLRSSPRPPSLSTIAAEIGRHPSHVARDYRRHSGSTIGQRARRLQVARAAAAIAGSRSPLAHIAHDAGFADQSHMGRVFKALMGTSPAAYRRDLCGDRSGVRRGSASDG